MMWFIFLLLVCLFWSYWSLHVLINVAFLLRGIQFWGNWSHHVLINEFFYSFTQCTGIFAGIYQELKDFVRKLVLQQEQIPMDESKSLRLGLKWWRGPTAITRGS